MSSIKAGFIGMGSMGMPMARSLANSTLPLSKFSDEIDMSIYSAVSERMRR